MVAGSPHNLCVKMEHHIWWGEFPMVGIGEDDVQVAGITCGPLDPWSCVLVAMGPV